MLAINISSFKTRLGAFDAWCISSSFLWNSIFLRIAPLAFHWARDANPCCLATSNWDLLRSLVSGSIWTCCSLRVSFNSHCSLVSFVNSSCRLSVVSGTVESVSSHSLCWGFLDFLPPLLAEVVLDFFPALCAGTWHPYRLHLSRGKSACGAVGGYCFDLLGNHPLPSFSLMCTRHSSSLQSIQDQTGWLFSSFLAFSIDAFHASSSFLTSSWVVRLLFFSVSIVVTPSCFLKIMVMKAFDGVGCMFEVASQIPDFVVFGRVTGPLGPVLEFVVVELRADDFVKFVFVFSFYLNRRRGFLNLGGEFVVLLGFEERNVECVVYSHRGWKVQFIGFRAYLCGYLEWSYLFPVQFLGSSSGVDVAW